MTEQDDGTTPPGVTEAEATTPEQAYGRLRESWIELRAEIEAVAQQMHGLKIDMLERDRRIELVRERVRKLHVFARSRREELAADIAKCGASFDERALMQQTLAHIFTTLEQVVRTIGELR